ncbi:MAG: efflux RND transporter periplasmic adaptor subunit [Clostridia bacterium]|nr:efflux RND transporter periplasmic adaptor subunit [Clostridia bacterium]
MTEKERKKLTETKDEAKEAKEVKETKKVKVKKDKKNLKEKSKKAINDAKEKIKNIDTQELKEKGKKKVKEGTEYAKKNPKRVIIWIIVIFVVIFAIQKISSLINKAVSQSQSGLAVSVEEIALDEIDNSLVYSAKVEAESVIPVILKASGEVKEVYVKIGDEVKEGQVLFTIDQEDLYKNVRALNASYNSAIAASNAAKANYENSKVNVETIEANYKAACELYEMGAISEVEYKQAVASYEYGASGATNSAYAQWQQAQAAVEQARIGLENAREVLNDARVKSPIDGVVSNLTVKEKTMLQAGVAPCTVVNADELEINVSVSESVISLIKPGDEVEVSLNAFPGEKFKGIIDAVSSASTTGVYPVVIKLENDEDKIKSGMFGRVTFSTNKKDKTIVIPKDALIVVGEEKYVFIYDNKKAVRVDVETGIDNGKDVEIISGLEVGDKLIVKGQDYVEDGDKVRLVEG